MDTDDFPMAPSDDSPSTTSNPSSPASPPAPPPLPPPPLLPPISTQQRESSSRLLPSFVGPLETANRSALRQKKWPLILLLPRHNSVSAPTSPTRPRPAWGPDAYHAPKKFNAPPELIDNILFWRRTASSSDAERYTAFFPVDGLPHLALLDPRSGERLAVWGNVDGEGMDINGVTDVLWENVQADLLDFLKHHSLEDGVLGPAHYKEKSWAVRTRRVAEKRAVEDALPPTSVMDDEDAAIAAAIAASLAEKKDDSYFGDTGSDDEHEHDDDESDGMFSRDTSSQDDDDGNDSNTVSDDFAQHQSIDDNEQKGPGTSSPQGVAVQMSPNVGNIPPPPRRAILIPSRGDPLPSSVESLSSSYLERMESCFRSSTNTALMETRRLRQEQDAELAASLQEDRQREEQERAEAERKAARKQGMLDAAASLPDEPAETAKALTIAIRLPVGKRIVRRFNSFDPLRSVADFAIAESGCISLTERPPEAGLKIAGVRLAGLGWNVALGALGLNSRTMIILNE